MDSASLSPLMLRQHLDALEGQLPGYWIDGPYLPTSRSGVSNWQAIAYPRGPFDMTGLRQAKLRIDALKVEQPTVNW